MTDSLLATYLPYILGEHLLLIPNGDNGDPNDDIQLLMYYELIPKNLIFDKFMTQRILPMFWSCWFLVILDQGFEAKFWFRF